MRAKLIVSLICVGVLTFVQVQSQSPKDTTIHFNQKTIYLTDSADQLKVKVFKTDTTELKRVYEGIFTDEGSFEQYSVATQFSFDYPFSKKKKKAKVQGHFVGIGAGALYTHNDFANINSASGMEMTFSNEIFWNPIGYTLPVIDKYFGLTSGIGMTWRNLHLGNNTHLVNSNNVSVVEEAPAGITYYYSRLRTFDFTVPFYAELQPLGRSGFFISGGVLFGVNTFSSYKVKYKNSDDRKVKSVEGKDYNVNPFSLSYVAQMGWNDIGIYCRYTPTSFFKEDKGPDVQTMSVGFVWNF